MRGAEGLQQRCVSVCGKVPYRLLGAFRPVRRFHPFPCLPDAGRRPTCRYNHKSSELLRAGIGVCLRGNEKKRV